MPYPFKYDKSFPVFDFTFIAKVICRFELEGNVKDKYECFSTFFNEYFKLDLSHERFVDIEKIPIRIASNDECLTWDFAPSFISLIIEGAVYSGYGRTLAPLIDTVSDFIRKSGLKCSAVFLQKINIFPFDKQEKTEVAGIYDMIISEEFFKLRPESPYIKEDSAELFQNSFKSDDELTRTNIVSGYIVQSSPEDDTSRIILDVNSKMSSIKNDSIEQSVSEINQLIDGAFFWAVRSEVVSLMENGSNE